MPGRGVKLGILPDHEWLGGAAAFVGTVAHRDRAFAE
jgi:hypothetical protein